MAQIRNFTSTNDSYFVLDGVSYPKVYEAMLDSGYTKDRVKLVGTNRDSSPLVFSTHYSNIKVDGISFANAQEAISRLNQVVFSKGGGSGGGGTTGNYIPLSGTEVGKPVTGYIISKEAGYILISNDDKTLIKIWNNDGAGCITIYNPSNENNQNLEIRPNEIYFGNDDNHTNITKVGESLHVNGSSYLVDNPSSIVNKDYADLQHSYSTTETKTGGTWIDGKPIYTITQLTADPIPADIETQFPNIIVGSYTVYKYTKTID